MWTIKATKDTPSFLRWKGRRTPELIVLLSSKPDRPLLACKHYAIGDGGLKKICKLVRAAIYGDFYIQCTAYEQKCSYDFTFLSSYNCVRFSVRICGITSFPRVGDVNYYPSQPFSLHFYYNEISSKTGNSSSLYCMPCILECAQDLRGLLTLFRSCCCNGNIGPKEQVFHPTPRQFNF